jgi:hypothetical protein
LERNRPDYIIEEPKELIDILNKEGAGVVG